MTGVVRILSQFQNPDHTGANRCTPCTVVNLVLAAVLTAIVGYLSLAVGIVVGIGSLASIFFRGYLVPGTPWLTTRFLPDRILAWFEDDEHEPPILEDDFTFETVEKIEYERENRVDGEAFLSEESVVVTDPETGDRRLTQAFHDALAEPLERYRGTPMTDLPVGEMMDVPSTDVTFLDRSYPAIKPSRRIRKWPSEAALTADVASHETLSTISTEWVDLPIEQRLELLEAIRSLYERCPACGGEVGFDETAVESCCRTYEVVTYRCRDCESILVEMDPEAVESGAEYKGVVP